MFTLAYTSVHNCASSAPSVMGKVACSPCRGQQAFLCRAWIKQKPTSRNVCLGEKEGRSERRKEEGKKEGREGNLPELVLMPASAPTSSAESLLSASSQFANIMSTHADYGVRDCHLNMTIM